MPGLPERVYPVYDGSFTGFIEPRKISVTGPAIAFLAAQRRNFTIEQFRVCRQPPVIADAGGDNRPIAGFRAGRFLFLVIDNSTLP